MKTNTSKGFTIIELLVVVAIIAVLAAIVLVNVTGYINQGKNAAIKGNLATILTNGAVYFDTNGNYTNFCANAYVTGPEAAITAAGGTPTETCSATAWCACSTMKTTTAEPAGSTFCVDSTGYKKVTANAGACAVRCPAAGACID
jgi:type IV pilus assembly protein PilE